VVPLIFLAPPEVELAPLVGQRMQEELRQERTRQAVRQERNQEEVHRERSQVATELPARLTRPHQVLFA